MGPNEKKNPIDESDKNHLMDEIEENYSDDEAYIDLVVNAFEALSEENDDEKECGRKDEDSILAEFGYIDEDE